jgi:hypothetical protein
VILKFKDDVQKNMHNEFQEWRSKNPNGYFLTEKTKTKANLHGSCCHHLGDTKWELESDIDKSLTKSIKVCGSLDDLKNWANKNEIIVKICKDCLRDKFLPDDIEVFLKSAILGDILKTSADMTTEEVDLRGVSEGSEMYRTHKTIERDRKIVERKKELHLREFGHLKCEVCSFDFSKRYGELGEGYIECHHIVPLAQAGLSETKLTDLVLVCANCHRMLHRKIDLISVEILKKSLK